MELALDPILQQATAPALTHRTFGIPVTRPGIGQAIQQVRQMTPGQSCNGRCKIELRPLRREVPHIRQVPDRQPPLVGNLIRRSAAKRGITRTPTLRGFPLDDRSPDRVVGAKPLHPTAIAARSRPKLNAPTTSANSPPYTRSSRSPDAASAPVTTPPRRRQPVAGRLHAAAWQPHDR